MSHSSRRSIDSSVVDDDSSSYDSDRSFRNSSRSTAGTDYSVPHNTVTSHPVDNNGSSEHWLHRSGPPVQRVRKVSFDDEARGSIELVDPSYDASTLSLGQEVIDDMPKFEIPDEHDVEIYPSSAIPATPADFAELFPSTRRLNIVHDDSASDGNMGLRVDCSDRGDLVTLFYLRMYDLRTRDFSLRRYCRASGREVCHFSRQTRQQQQQQNSSRPTLTRSLSSFLTKGHSTTSKSDVEKPLAGTLSRHDSGYGSVHGDDDDEDDEDDINVDHPQQPQPSIDDLTDTVNMEFSNYFHLPVKRVGIRSKKHYGFDYWGKKYSWKRVMRKDFGVEVVSYHLVRHSDKKILAHIIPVSLSVDEAREEQYAGGWIPPCSFFFGEDVASNEISNDLGDIIMATGLLSLVDDTIRKRFHSKESRQHATSVMAKLDPRRIIDEAFGRSHVQKGVKENMKVKEKEMERPHTAH